MLPEMRVSMIKENTNLNEVEKSQVKKRREDIKHCMIVRLKDKSRLLV